MAPVSSVGVGNAPVSSDDLVGALLGGVPGDGPHDGGRGAAVGAANTRDPGPVGSVGPVGAEMAAVLLGLPEHGPYAVLALTSVVDDGGPQGHLASRDAARSAGGPGAPGALGAASGPAGAPGGLQVGSGMRTVWCAAPPPPPPPPGQRYAGPVVRAHAIVHLGDAELADLVKALDPPPGLRVGVSPAVDGPAKLARGRVLAERALRANPDAPVAVLEERLPAAVVADSPDLARLLISRALGPVLELPCADRDSLLSTLRAWLESGGSTRRAGNRLFYHPNTVLNRLRRYEQLTGRLLGDPVSVVELSLALDAYRIAEAR
ncbi:PucR family transcriptional regulator [Streptodolium elevatio]|uniref:Helix-turn-helix domain-containing protein n=1 Tax=Streptodolium elevatio TaxID=3157996 RepID=A0ABV3DHH6_9ACTN